MKIIKESPPFIHTDESHLYMNDEPFFLDISDSEKSNSFPITLSARPESDLFWDEEIKVAKKVASKGKFILWYFDFGFKKEDFQLHFAARKLALNHFIKNHFDQFKTVTLGFLLYKGPILSDSSEEYFSWLKDHELIDRGYYRKLFWMESFSYRMSLFAHCLPDEASLFLAFDAKNIQSHLEKIKLFSKDYFEHMVLIVRGIQHSFAGVDWMGSKGKFGRFFSSKIEKFASEKMGLVIPSKIDLDKTLFDDVIEKLKKNEKSFRILYENFLVTEWDQLDDLIVSQKHMTRKISRMTQGFCAAGGRILTFKEFLEK